MTKEDLINKIEGCINDACMGATSQEEAVQSLATVFIEALQPFISSRQHLKLFIHRVQVMRNIQQQYFSGKKSVLVLSKQEEQKVDNAIKKLTSELGYTPEDLNNQYQQSKLM